MDSLVDPHSLTTPRMGPPTAATEAVQPAFWDMPLPHHLAGKAAGASSSSAMDPAWHDDDADMEPATSWLTDVAMLRDVGHGGAWAPPPVSRLRAACL